MVVIAGRERPSKGDDMKMGEGMAIVLLVPAMMHGRELGNSSKHGIREQSKHACR